MSNRPHLVLVGHAEEVALLDRELRLSSEGSNLLHGGDHVLVPALIREKRREVSLASKEVPDLRRAWGIRDYDGR